VGLFSIAGQEKKVGHMVRVDSKGRVVLPLMLRKRLGVDKGGDLFLSISGQGIRLESTEQRIREAITDIQESFTDADYRLDDFLAERKEEARKDDAKWDGV